MTAPNVTHLNRDAKTYYTASNATTAPAPRKFVAKGHDAQLQGAQINHTPTVITLISGEKARGIIVKRDKYTITLRYSEGTRAGMEEIFYKSAIESVLIENPLSH